MLTAKPIRSRWPQISWFIDVLHCVAFEALIVAIAASNLARGMELQEEDRERLLVAASCLQAAAEVCDE